MLHADACRAVASHGVANQAAASSLWNRAVMSVDIRDNIVRDESLKVSGGYRIRIHGAVVQRYRIGQNDDHLFRSLGESAFNGLGHMDLVGPLFCADGISVECIHDGIAARLLPGIARR